MKDTPALKITENCPMCKTKSPLFYSSKKKRFFECSHCLGIFASKDFLPDDALEVERYTAHNNDVNDPRYREFVRPITSHIEKYFGPTHKGLDFGSGTGPVITVYLREKGYEIETFDPFFDNRPEVLNHTYDYIACCEVIEHFHKPHEEFKKLRNLLKPNGKLFLMTDPYHDAIDFQNWYYKNDPTHVFLYRNETFQWIQKEFNFKSVEIKGRLIIFSI